MKYVIFQTEWGYFGLLGSDKGLIRTCLPTPGFKQAERHLLQSARTAQFNSSFLQELQQCIIAYFQNPQGDSFRHIHVDLSELTPFQRKVLTACRTIATGKTATYGLLAKKIGKPKAARAVGSALARNPIPLIIPCHRILAANNRLGGFSAPGGIMLKERLLKHEKR